MSLLLALDALSSADIAQPILRQLIFSVVNVFEGAVFQNSYLCVHLVIVFRFVHRQVSLL